MNKKKFTMELSKTVFRKIGLVWLLVVASSSVVLAAEIRGDLEIDPQLSMMEQSIHCGGAKVFPTNQNSISVRSGSYSINYENGGHSNCEMCFSTSNQDSNGKCVDISSDEALQIFNIKIIGNQNDFYVILR